MVNVDSIHKCRQLCLDEQRFTCRSAVYDAARLNCLLSDMNRHTIENTYSDRVELANNKPIKAKFVPTEPYNQHVHYLENKCHQGKTFDLHLMIINVLFLLRQKLICRTSQIL